MRTWTPETYKSDDGFSITGLPVLVVILLVTASVLGWLASFIGQWFYLILLFPFAIGMGLVLVGVMAGHAAKMRNSVIAALLGLMSAAVALLVMHYCDYRRFRADRAAEIAKVEALPGGLDQHQAILLQGMKQAMEVSSFPAYMNLAATQGVTIGRGGGINLGYSGTWIYWSLEFIGVAFLTTFGLIGAAMAPFCAACDQWKEEKQLGTLEGPTDRVLAILTEGDLGRLAGHLPSGKEGRLVLSASVCPNCQGQSAIAVKLMEITTNAKGEDKSTELAHLSYPGEAQAEFEAVFATPRGDQP